LSSLRLVHKGAGAAVSQFGTRLCKRVRQVGARAV
jgi:hypothetical protein